MTRECPSEHRGIVGLIVTLHGSGLSEVLESGPAMNAGRRGARKGCRGSSVQSVLMLMQGCQIEIGNV